MYLIKNKVELNDQVVRMDILAPEIAKKALPGQFIIFRIDEMGERIPLTIADTDKESGLVTIIYQTIGGSTMRLATLNEGDYIQDFVGPLGIPTHVSDDVKRVCVVGGGVGCAIAFPQAKYLHSIGLEVDVIAGFRNKDIVILEDLMREHSTNLYITTDDGSYGEKGLVTEKLDALIQEKGKYDLVITIGPIPMMKFVCGVTKKYEIPSIVSLNPIMIDGTGMCGCCRVSVNGEVKFACVDGPDFDGHTVDFDELIKRNSVYKNEEQKAREKDCRLLKKEVVEHPKKPSVTFEKPVGDKVERNMSNDKVAMPEQDGNVRNKNYAEVTLGYTPEMAIEEARRCLDCKHKPCVNGCPVKVRIPEFIQEVAKGEFEKAYQIVKTTNALPAVCGRVCPQETQCEEKCVRAIKGESVGIGRLERFVADWHLANEEDNIKEVTPNGKKVAIIGAGPAGLTCAGELAKHGYDITIFEAFHVAGGVLVYGIPEFRLPKKIVEVEINNLKAQGVKIELNALGGRAITIDELKAQGFDAIFIGTGAGLPSFMNIEGESLGGVYSANEYLTRVNLMKGYDDNYETPVQDAKRVAVVGGGNVAMDAARCAKRVGAEDVYIVYRRDRDGMPARLEEIHHAEDEEIELKLLTNPIRVIGNDEGFVTGLECIKMELGEPDDSGRRKPVPVKDSNFVIDVDAVIMSIGTSPNPLIADVTDGLDSNKWGCIVVDDEMRTTLDGVYAGGDATVGAATVIYAMGCGKTAGETIHKDLQNK